MNYVKSSLQNKVIYYIYYIYLHHPGPGRTCWIILIWAELELVCMTWWNSCLSVLLGLKNTVMSTSCGNEFPPDTNSDYIDASILPSFTSCDGILRYQPRYHPAFDLWCDFLRSLLLLVLQGLNIGQCLYSPKRPKSCCSWHLLMWI